MTLITLISRGGIIALSIIGGIIFLGIMVLLYFTVFMKAHYEAVKQLSDALKDYFGHKDGVLMNTPANASPYVINISLKKKKASVVVEALSNKGIYVSSVSA